MDARLFFINSFITLSVAYIELKNSNSVNAPYRYQLLE